MKKRSAENKYALFVVVYLRWGAKGQEGCIIGCRYGSLGKEECQRSSLLSSAGVVDSVGSVVVTGSVGAVGAVGDVVGSEGSDGVDVSDES